MNNRAEPKTKLPEGWHWVYNQPTNRWQASCGNDESMSDRVWSEGVVCWDTCDTGDDYIPYAVVAAVIKANK